VHIDDDQYGKNHEINRPDLFVTFVSTPGEALKKELGRWESFKSKAATATGVKKNLGSSDGVRAWPRTRTKASALDASWDEVVQFKVRTHDDNGRPIDLSGAMIHVAVLDGRSHDLMGIFPLNLAYLITNSRKGSQLEKTQSYPERENSRPSRWTDLRRIVGHGSLERDEDHGVRQEGKDVDGNDHLGNDKDVDLLTSGPSAQLLLRVLKNGRRSLMGSSSREGNASLTHRSQLLDSMEVFSMNVNQPLRKYGITVGRIQFTVDSWWLSDEAAEKRARSLG
jgi:hypothetical protein